MRVTEAEARELLGKRAGEVLAGRVRPDKPKRPRISPLYFGTRPLGSNRRGGENNPQPTDEYTLILPLPPTKNHEPRNVYERQDVKNHWSNLASAAWIAAKRPYWNRVRVTPRVYCKRGRDVDNFFGCAIKGVIDGLKGRMMPDDRAEYLEIGEVEFIYDQPAKSYRLELHIRGIEEELRCQD